MTATKFFQMCRERDVEICGLISMYHPDGINILDANSPQSQFSYAVESLNYELAEKILRETRIHVPKNLGSYTRLSELLEEPTVKKINKYYIGSQDIAKAIQNGNNSRVTFASLDEAVQEGKNRINEDGADTIIVVEIVRVIRREKPVPPVTVEVV